MSDIRTMEMLFLLLLLFIVAFGQLSRRIQTPYPIVMIVGGLLFGLIPGIPRIQLAPDLIFLVVLPPLLYSSAWVTSWRDFRFNLVPILSLAFGLVGFTVLGVALITPRVLLGFDWRLGLVLGAIVAPTDAIAATSIARRIGLPSRIVDVLEGESLINDATGLLALQFAIALLVSGTIPTIGGSLLTLAWLTIGGIAIGLVIGWIVAFAEKKIDDGPIEIALSILVPYAAYFAADSVHASGVLAVVACGLFLTRRSPELFSPAVRIQIYSFWQSFTFVLNGLVFVLIGLQLPFILNSIREYSKGRLVLDRRCLQPPVDRTAGWSGSSQAPGSPTRSAVCWGNAMSNHPSRARSSSSAGQECAGSSHSPRRSRYPQSSIAGKVFPERDLIVFLTFCVILVTLVLQGITLPPLVRALGLSGANGPDCEEQDARRLVTQAAVSHLEAARLKDTDAAREVYEDILGHYRQRLASLQPGDQNPEGSLHHQRLMEISRDAEQIERQTAVQLRNEGRINDAVLRKIERELDLNETRFTNGDDE